MAGLPDFVKKLDIFGAPTPGFNLKGKEVITTSCGSLVSIIIYSLTFAFSLLKL